MARLKRFIPLLFAFFLGGTASVAVAEEQEDLISVNLMFFSPFRPNPPKLFYRNGGEIQQVRYPRTIQGEFFEYEGPPLMQFFTRESGNNGTFTYTLVSQVELSEDKDNHLLIFNVRNRDSEEPDISVNVMDININSFPAGTMTIVNLTGIQMQAMIGEDANQIPPGISQPISFDARGVFPLGLAFEFDDRVYPSFFNTVTLDPETRQWLFIGPPVQRGSTRVRVRFVEDHSMLRRHTGQ